MSATLATVADALIEFILSLLRDPQLKAEFDQDPEGTLAGHGLGGASAADVCAVAPVIVERHDVVPTPSPNPTPTPHHNPAVHEIKNVTTYFTAIDDRDTIVDQSVNQNIWTEGGDLTQNFDNDAVVASGDDAIAAGNDVGIENNLDKSTNVDATDSNINIGSDVDTTTSNDSFNDTDTTTSTETNDTDVSADGSFNDTNTDVAVSDSGNTISEENTDVSADVDANVVYESDDSYIEDSSDDQL